MIFIKNIEKTDYEELLEMYYDYYKQVLGTDWTSKIPITKIREFLDFNKDFAEKQTAEAVSDIIPKNMIDKRVLGLYIEEDIIGFACVGIFADNVGGIYSIYIKPEYRKKFIINFKDNKSASEYLLEGVREYFLTNDIDTVELEVPHTIGALKKVVEKNGFIPQAQYNDATKYSGKIKKGR